MKESELISLFSSFIFSYSLVSAYVHSLSLLNLGHLSCWCLSWLTVIRPTGRAAGYLGFRYFDLMFEEIYLLFWEMLRLAWVPRPFLRSLHEKVIFFLVIQTKTYFGRVIPTLKAFIKTKKKKAAASFFGF